MASIRQGGVFGAVASSDDFIKALSPEAAPTANGHLANGVSKPERTVTVKAEPYDYELPAHKAALIMIDFQKDFMLPGGFGDALGNKIELLKVRRLLWSHTAWARVELRIARDRQA